MGAGRRWAANARQVTVSDYTAPHPQSVAIVNAFFGRHLAEVHGYGSRVAFGEQTSRGGGAFSGELGPHQRFKGAAAIVGNVDHASGLQSGLPNPTPPGGRVPTVYDLLRDMDSRTGSGLAATGGMG